MCLKISGIPLIPFMIPNRKNNNNNNKNSYQSIILRLCTAAKKEINLIVRIN